MSKLSQALESGKPIKGLKGYIRLKNYKDEDDDLPIYILVKCRGVDVDGCNVKILADVVSGSGTVQVCPDEWLDSPEGIRADKERIEKIKTCRHEFQELKSCFYQHQRRVVLEKYIAEWFTEEELRDFYTALQEEFGLNVRPTRIPPKISKDDLRKYSIKAITIANKATPEEMEQVDSQYW